MKKTKKSFVKTCGFGALPDGHTFMEMEVVVDNQLFSCTIEDPNWKYSEETGRLCYQEPRIEIEEEKKYKISSYVEELSTGESKKMTTIEKELALDMLFAKCKEEMTQIRQQQEDKMMKLFGMDEDEFDSLSEEELDQLGEIYKVESK